MAYTPLDSQIIHSSVWREDDQTRILWVTMLAMANRDGFVKCSLIGLADAAKITLENTERALARLQSPDRYSSDRTDGRRIEETDGGWMILNFLMYRNRAQEEVAREKAAARQRKWYGKNKGKPVAPKDEPTPDPKSPPSKGKRGSHSPIPLPEDLKGMTDAWNDFDNHRRAIHKPITPRAAELMFADFRSWGVNDAIQSIYESIKSGWQGIFPMKANGGTRQKPGTANRTVNQQRVHDLLENRPTTRSGGKDEPQ